jgi:exodeoxyribonuclease VII large subunit
MNTFNKMQATSRPIPSLNRNIGADTSSITVTQLNRQVKSMLENSFLSIRVQGELSNFAKPSSGHWYFTLKDTKAQIRCAMFKGSNRHLNFSPKEGDAVIVQAKVSLYEGRGDYQLICDSMEEAGSGRLQLAFEQLKAKLLKEGLFDNSYKKRIPDLVKHLAVITSSSGAAIHDVLSVLKRRYPGLPVTIYPSQVQGREASTTIIKALEQAQQGDCDLVLITRGGGSLEDLWPFNEEKLARAIFTCNLPVISAVGHEVDFSICDLVADYRAPTPSAAAELISPDQDHLRIKIDQLQHRLYLQIKAQLQARRNTCATYFAKLQSPQQHLTLQRLRLNTLSARLPSPVSNQLTTHRQQLKLLKQRLESNNPQHQVNRRKTQLDYLQTRIHQLIIQQAQNKDQQLRSTVAMLNSVSPLATLERGYSITQSGNKKVITDSAQTTIGETIVNKLHKGEIHSIVSHIEK